MAVLSPGATAVVELYCVRCTDVRYESRRPLSAEDRLVPELFQPRDGAPELRADAPYCPRCGTMLRLRAADVADAPAPAASRETDAPPPPAAPAASVGGSLVTVFAAANGERVLAAMPLPLPTGVVFLVTTDRRVVVTAFEVPEEGGRREPGR